MKELLIYICLTGIISYFFSWKGSEVGTLKQAHFSTYETLVLMNGEVELHQSFDLYEKIYLVSEEAKVDSKYKNAIRFINKTEDMTGIIYSYHALEFAEGVINRHFFAAENLFRFVGKTLYFPSAGLEEIACKREIRCNGLEYCSLTVSNKWIIDFARMSNEKVPSTASIQLETAESQKFGLNGHELLNQEQGRSEEIRNNNLPQLNTEIQFLAEDSLVQIRQIQGQSAAASTLTNDSSIDIPLQNYSDKQQIKESESEDKHNENGSTISQQDNERSKISSESNEHNAENSKKEQQYQKDGFNKKVLFERQSDQAIIQASPKQQVALEDSPKQQVALEDSPKQIFLQQNVNEQNDKILDRQLKGQEVEMNQSLETEILIGEMETKQSENKPSNDQQLDNKIVPQIDQTKEITPSNEREIIHQHQLTESQELESQSLTNIEDFNSQPESPEQTDHSEEPTKQESQSIIQSNQQQSVEKPSPILSLNPSSLPETLQSEFSHEQINLKNIQNFESFKLSKHSKDFKKSNHHENQTLQINTYQSNLQSQKDYSRTQTTQNFEDYSKELVNQKIETQQVQQSKEHEDHREESQKQLILQNNSDQKDEVTQDEQPSQSQQQSPFNNSNSQTNLQKTNHLHEIIASQQSHVLNQKITPQIIAQSDNINEVTNIPTDEKTNQEKVTSVVLLNQSDSTTEISPNISKSHFFNNPFDQLIKGVKKKDEKFGSQIKDQNNKIQAQNVNQTNAQAKEDNYAHFDSSQTSEKSMNQIVKDADKEATVIEQSKLLKNTHIIVQQTVEESIQSLNSQNYKPAERSIILEEAEQGNVDEVIVLSQIKHPEEAEAMGDLDEKGQDGLEERSPQDQL